MGSKFSKCCSPDPVPQQDQKVKFIRIVVIGDKGVGKSTLITKYMNTTQAIKQSIRKPAEDSQLSEIHNKTVTITDDETDQSYTVTLTITEIKGSSSVNAKQIRNGEFKNANMILFIHWICLLKICVLKIVLCFKSI